MQGSLIVYPGLGYTTTSNVTGLQHQPALEHRGITLTGGKRVEPLFQVDYLKKNPLTIHPTAKDFHYMWKKAGDTEAKCLSEAKEYNKQRYGKTHKEPDFREGYQVLVSTLKFNNLKGPNKMRDLPVGTFTIIRFIPKNAVEFRLTEELSRKHPVFPVTLKGEDKFPARNKS
ncbi:hypothetical protein O181_001680 [Austropuccinia psidii MF-1]|uniref:Uncharacterized protein n=1 Tax=Austropuccinia psidii MF-1 TaxID=1389203 RepID=A0A9Q3GC28_9BASI|nr:hypothetical protein [Austropuccinia psidii MF-1]